MFHGRLQWFVLVYKVNSPIFFTLVFAVVVQIQKSTHESTPTPYHRCSLLLSVQSRRRHLTPCKNVTTKQTPNHDWGMHQHCTNPTAAATTRRSMRHTDHKQQHKHATGDNARRCVCAPGLVARADELACSRFRIRKPNEGKQDIGVGQNIPG